MWKRDEAVKTPQPAVKPSGQPAPAPIPAHVPTSSAPSMTPSAAVTTAADTTRHQERGPVNIGKSVIIKGDLTGSEDLTIEGQVEGKIELRQNILTIGANGKIKAQIFAKAVVVLGEVVGNVTASERVDIRDNGSVDGDLSAPRVSIADGAHFRGAIDMQKGKVDGKADTKTPATAGAH